MAPSRAPGSSAPISTEVSSTARIYANGSASSPGKSSSSPSSVRGAGVFQILASSGPLTHWRRRAGPRVRDRSAGDGDHEPLARLCTPQHFGDVVAELLLRDHRHVATVAE